jgi:hypothetical protein
MQTEFLNHLQRNWPLAVIAGGLLVYLPISLVQGVFHTNQGRILKSAEPARYWRWVLSFLALEAACTGVLAGSFLLSR